MQITTEQADAYEFQNYTWKGHITKYSLVQYPHLLY